MLLAIVESSWECLKFSGLFMRSKWKAKLLMWWESFWRWSNMKSKAYLGSFCFRILALRYQLKLWSYLKAQLEKICLQNHMVVGRIQFLVSGMTEGFNSVDFWPGETLSSLPHGSHHASQCSQLLHWSQQEGRSVGKTYMTVLCNIVTDVTSHHHCHILLLESNHRSAYAQDEYQDS